MNLEQKWSLNFWVERDLNVVIIWYWNSESNPLYVMESVQLMFSEMFRILHKAEGNIPLSPHLWLCWYLVYKSPSKFRPIELLPCWIEFFMYFPAALLRSGSWETSVTSTMRSLEAFSRNRPSKRFEWRLSIIIFFHMNFSEYQFTGASNSKSPNIAISERTAVCILRILPHLLPRERGNGLRRYL